MNNTISIKDIKNSTILISGIDGRITDAKYIIENWSKLPKKVKSSIYTVIVIQIDNSKPFLRVGSRVVD